MHTPSPPLIRTQAVRYHEDVSALFAQLVGDTADAHSPVVLLESADIASKEGLKSVAVLAAAARLTCEGDTVTVESLTPTGGYYLDLIRSQLAPTIIADQPQQLQLRFARSTEPDERARLRALSPVEPLRIVQQHPLDTNTQQPEPGFPFLTGGFAFDFLGSFEQLPQVQDGVNGYPDYQFVVAEVLLSVDHQAQTATVACLGTEVAEVEEKLAAIADKVDAAKVDAAPAPAGGEPTHPGESGKVVATAQPSDAQFCATVEKLQSAIQAGDIYQVVPARTFAIDCGNAFAAYRSLRELNPSPYMFYLRGAHRGETFELFGASPESNLKYTPQTGEVELYPIAGTRPRGLNPDGSINHELDTRAELELRTDAKEIAEHTMLVDLARNDLARVAAPGTRQVKQLLHVDRYSRVMHLVSRVTAHLAEDLDALDAYRACMNMGTLTGAPKLRAMELIREVEGTRRGSYGGAVGYLGAGGVMDTCIVIRSAFVHNGMAYVQAGAGVVRDSIPQSEADETLHKAYAVLQSIALAQGADLEVRR